MSRATDDAESRHLFRQVTTVRHATVEIMGLRLETQMHLIALSLQEVFREWRRSVGCGRACILAIAMASALGAAPVVAEDSAAHWESTGRALFLACDFEDAAHAFMRALANDPENAELHYWLGKSYVHLADSASLFTAPRQARKAPRSLERAVQIEPRNREYLQELFDFYLGSADWFGGGLDRAAALAERISALDASAGISLQMRLAASAKEHSGAGWSIQRMVLRTSGALGELVPHR